jgi:protein-export membrane protein SecD/preprotein translocase SecF subunit
MKQFLTFLALVALAAVAGWYSLSPQFPIAKGLDLQGGMRVVFEPDDTKPDGQNVPADKILRVRDVLESRVNSFGLSGAEVRLKGDKQILVMLPGAKNPKEALGIISKVAQLEFRHLRNVQSERNANGRYRMSEIKGDPTKGEADEYQFTDTIENKKVPVDQVLEDSPLILKGNLLRPNSKPQLSPSNGQPYVEFELNPEGAKVFGDFTSENQGEILAVVLDGKVITAPNIREPITEGHGQISGGFKNMGEARVLANLLNSGSLPVPLRAAETQVVGATLGQESIDRSIKAGLVGLGLVVLFMLGYYWLPGFLACIALLVYSALTFAIFKGAGIFPPIVLDLPGITGFILSVGMAVDANVLIFERLKEELKAGKSLHAAVDAGFSRAFTSIFDSNVTTWIVCGILICLGAPKIKCFAIKQAIGVAVSMFTAITVTRTLLHLAMDLGIAKNPAVFGLGVSWLGMFFPPSKQGGILKVYEKRGIYFGFTIALTVLAVAFIAMTPMGNGLKLGIDFTGGSQLEAAYRQAVPQTDVEKILADAGVKASVRAGKSEVPWTTFEIEAQEVDKANQSVVKDRLAKSAGLESFYESEYKASTEGKTFKATAVYTAEIPEDVVRTAFNKKLDANDVNLDLKGLKINRTVQQHAGSNAITVYEITTDRLSADQMTSLKDKLSGIGGGLIQPMSQESFIGPSVAREVTFNAFASVAVASLAIILYLAFRFAIGGFVNGLKFGVCAVIALIHDVGITIGLFALMGALQGWKIDSLFVTAALTVLGFSVHDTIVVYDRIRENLRHRERGETFAHVSDRSITQTFDRSVNTSLTVLLVVAALVFLGGESIRLFNVALLFGIAIGTYSSIFVASPLVVLIEQKMGNKTPVQTAPGGGSMRSTAPKPAAAPKRPATPVGQSASATNGTTPDGAAADATEARPSTSGTVKPKRKRRM